MDSASRTFKAVWVLSEGLEKGYKFFLDNVTELTSVNEIIQADNALKEIYIYNPDGTLAYIQNEKGADNADTSNK